MILPGDKKRVRELMKSDNYDALERVAGETIEKWQKENVIGVSEFETLKMVFTRENKIQGVKDFLEKLEQYAGES